MDCCYSNLLLILTAIVSQNDCRFHFYHTTTLLNKLYSILFTCVFRISKYKGKETLCTLEIKRVFDKNQMGENKNYLEKCLNIAVTYTNISSKALQQVTYNYNRQ